MTGVGYVRVSTEDQKINGVSLEMQITKIKQYAILNDIDLVGIYGDPGISAKAIDTRPGAVAVIDMARRKRIDGVIIYKLDRMFRNTIEALQTADMMNKYHVGLHSITEKLDTQSAIGEFFFTLMASLAQMERKLIGERTSSALWHKAQNGERVSRYAPMGSTFDRKGRVVEDPQEMEAIHLMRELRDAGHSYRQISDTLATGQHLSRTGKPYEASTIMRILKKGG
jgi:DNA invertase Pin-like site-specific DNA recombinase